MLNPEQIQDHLLSLEIGMRPDSPFFGMINFSEAGGLLTLPNDQQWQVFNAMTTQQKTWLNNYANELQSRKEEKGNDNPQNRP
tara:strand:+ start:124 stop:372 length:249 start_codon:yes stop_codon:yes gene_type:complete